MVTTVTSTAAASGTEQTKQSAALNKDDFLKLFVTQLQNQDPLNPQDGTEFIAQLAQLTQVEQAYNTNTNLQTLLNQGNSNAALASVALIGKEVEAPGSQVGLKTGSTSTINFSLSQAASKVTVTVKDASGATVKTITAGATGAGRASVSWDGSSDSGGKAAPGAYSFSVAASDASGNSVSSTTFIKGKVDGVDLSGAIPMLSIGGINLSLAAVTSVGGGA